MNPKHALLFRSVLLETLLLQALYQPQIGDIQFWLWPLLGFYAVYAIALSPGPWLFLGDILVTTLALVATGGISSDFYIAYFLVILGSCLLQKPSYSFFVGGAACLVYGIMAWPTLTTGAASTHLLRLSLLMTMTFFSALVVDTTRRSLERKTEEHQGQLVWLERLSLAGRLVASVLHDLKTPINTILMNAENTRELLGRPEQKVRAEEQLRIIEEESDRVAQILRDFLEFTSPTDLKLVPLTLRPLVEKAYAKIAAGFAPDTVFFHNRVSPDTRVMASERHLLQIFINLFDNAVNAMPLGGNLEVSETKNNGVVDIRVADSGKGISPETLARLFAPFETTQSQEGGHGLGLFAARWIAQRHGGAIRIESAGLKKGACAVLTLRAAPV